MSKKEFTEEMRVHFNGLIKTINELADRNRIGSEWSQYEALCSLLVDFSVNCESEINYPERKLKCQKEN